VSAVVCRSLSRPLGAGRREWRSNVEGGWATQEEQQYTTPPCDVCWWEEPTAACTHAPRGARSAHTVVLCDARATRVLQTKDEVAWVMSTAMRSVPSKTGQKDGLTKEQLKIALEAYSSYADSKPVIHAYFAKYDKSKDNALQLDELKQVKGRERREREQRLGDVWRCGSAWFLQLSESRHASLTSLTGVDPPTLQAHAPTRFIRYFDGARTVVRL